MKKNVARQLYQLQETDLEIESTEQQIRQVTAQLGESQKVIAARDKLASLRLQIEDLHKQQRSLEWETDDLSSKIAAGEKDLYGGRIFNPKELTTLQQEVQQLKARRRQLEDKELEVMEQVDATTGAIAAQENEVKSLEAEWQEQQKQLSARLEQLKSTLASLKQKREALAADIDAEAVTAYQELRKRKGTAVARVEQGTCRVCGVTLPASELQRARSGSLVRCGSCGRILFLA